MNNVSNISTVSNVPQTETWLVWFKWTYVYYDAYLLLYIGVSAISNSLFLHFQHIFPHEQVAFGKLLLRYTKLERVLDKGTGRTRFYKGLCNLRKTAESYRKLSNWSMIFLQVKKVKLQWRGSTFFFCKETNGR